MHEEEFDESIYHIPNQTFCSPHGINFRSFIYNVEDNPAFYLISPLIPLSMIYLNFNSLFCGDVLAALLITFAVSFLIMPMSLAILSFKRDLYYKVTDSKFLISILFAFLLSAMGAILYTFTLS
ncbi:hypothetical protein CUJ83_12755 [Methanocella sp. CWC-04]|uniref:Uncharacterized protein n=1 Tax=Methanooceanicella nereidis TaxID=2052831 RepID=A0AAP2RFJ7_9EURY|nr:hypothetical protein [Methanocella sp. CWC-04]MCD1295866.1 hypothetical protein [Methanocella sp. CWC-04]